MGCRARPIGCFRMSVDADIGDISEYPRASVAAAFEIEQVCRFIDEFCGIFIAQKCWVFEQVFDKGNIGAHTTNSKFAQRSIHTRDCLLGCGGPGCDLHQERVIIARDDAARIGSAAVKANAHAGGAAKGG